MLTAVRGRIGLAGAGTLLALSALVAVLVWPEPSAGTAVASPTPAPSGCRSAPPALVDAVGRGLTAGGARLGPGWIEPAGQADAFYVAAAIRVPEGDENPVIGVWVTNEPRGRGSVFSVEGPAVGASAWEPASATEVRFSARDPGARRAVACAGSPPAG